ncbi:substrate-binding domain-containing protein [Flavobacterium sp. CBA20B-1]|uniref:substrate-binding domain-containing protein n=1 Tax=unclassified Flavobacterium TaxID=196869 RepID=UPI002225ABEF|nr:MULTISPECIES: substrate-binding domain-containing protein [unclassified Flavobacterium]WCM42727.1 substrate-binding domain-containing protein [Flavobacterium sp. CBA20B-1]
MKTVRIVGVPEHFNFPWQLSIDEGMFNEIGIDLQWTDIPEGTGKMCKMLRKNETDLAVILTEGILKDIANGNESVILQTYVQSPLQWGIHVNAKSNYHTVDDLYGKKAAISRYGSGSELMTYVNAANQKWSFDSLSFEIINTLSGAVEALTNNTADYFMWDRFMTQPIVYQGVFRRIGVCPTPWPCFMIVARKDFYNQNKALVNNLIETINQTTAEFKMIPSIDKTLASVFNQKLEDIQQWLQITKWSQKKPTETQFNQIIADLIQFKIINQPLSYSEVVV